MVASVAISLNTMQCQVQGGPGNPRDFVGVYRPDAAADKYLSWKYLANDKQVRPVKGVSFGAVTLFVSSPTDTYEIRFYSISPSGTQTLQAKTKPFIFESSTTPPAPTPSGITFTPTTASLKDNAISGATVTIVAVSMSDGSTFSGGLTATPVGMVAISGSNLVLSRNLNPADQGTHQVSVNAQQNGGTVSGSIPIEVTAAVIQPPPGISPDGSVISAVPGGGGTGTLTTRYGTWTLGPQVFPRRAWAPAGTTSNEVWLNGKSVSQGYGFGLGDPPTTPEIRINYGGNVFIILQDQLWHHWTAYAWGSDDGFDYSTGPSGHPTPLPLPTYSPPYTPSPEGSMISGGTGSLQTTEGIFSFGAVNGSGWDLMHNGIPIWGAVVDMMKVHASGQIFFRMPGGVWNLWAGYQMNSSTGPTSAPVPIDIAFTPSNPTFLSSVPIGTTVSTFTVKMSDGSAFSGTTSIDSTQFIVSGSSIKTNMLFTQDDIVYGFFFWLTVSQNGSSFKKGQNLQSTFSAPPTADGTPFITKVTPGTLRNDTTSRFGMQFTVGPTPLTVTALGRYVTTGNSKKHKLSIESFELPLQPKIFGSDVEVDTAGATPGEFVYAPLTSNVVLWENKTYYILSEEVSGGDEWLVNNTVVTTTASAHLDDSAQFIPGLWIFAGGSGENKPFIPVDFKYNVGVPGGITRPGSVFASTNTYGSQGGQPYASSRPVVIGTTTFQLSWTKGPFPTGSLTFQWLMDGQPISPVMESTDAKLLWVCDTVALGIPDGTHIFYPVILDSSSWPVYGIRFYVEVILVNNSGGLNEGTQMVPVSAHGGNQAPSPMPDFVSYMTGNPHPLRSAKPHPYKFIPGSNSPDMRPWPGKWFGERLAGVANIQYATNPQWVTTKQGGVYAQYFQPEDYSSTQRAYPGVTRRNYWSGPRMNSLMSAFITMVEDPAGGGVWWGVEISGRVFKELPNGDVIDVVGRTRDKSQLTYDPFLTDVDEEDIESKMITLGNFPPELEYLGGANDLCFDPRDSNILYVACQEEHCIAKINLTTLDVTVYAGKPGIQGYTGDGGPATSATMRSPSSICITADGDLYICEIYNSCIREVDGTTGEISTLCGGTVGPTPPADITPLQGGASHAATSIVWDSVTDTGAVVMSGPTNIKLGHTLALTGATNSTGYNPNIRYIVTAWTDSQHFTVKLEPSNGNTSIIGVIGGAPIFTGSNSDLWSVPGTVSFANAVLPFPNAIRLDSNEDIVVVEPFTQAVRRIHRTTGTPDTITRIGLYGNSLDQDASETWFWLDIDIVGVLGPKDDIFLYKAQGSGATAHETWRMSSDGTYSAFSFIDVPGTAYIGPGHYPWAISLSRYEGRLKSSGFANYFPTTLRIKQPDDPDLNLPGGLEREAWDRGFTINLAGTPNGFPIGIRPAFQSLYGSQGGGFIMNAPGHNTFEEIFDSYPSLEEFGAFVQAGMGGSVPRPEMVGRPLVDFDYFVKRDTLRGRLGPVPYQKAPYPEDNSPPMILTASAVRNSPTQITVTWTTDKPTVGLAAASTPSQRSVSQYPYCLYSKINNAFGKSHSETMQVLAGQSPVHYTVVVQDQAGNFSHAVDQTIV